MTEQDFEGFTALLRAVSQAGCDVRIEIKDPLGRIGDLCIERDNDGWAFSQVTLDQAMEPHGVMWGLANMNAALLEVGQ